MAWAIGSIFLATLSLISRTAVAAPDLCALLTQTQVTAVLGASVGTGQSMGTTLKSCTWSELGGGFSGKKAYIAPVSVEMFNVSKSVSMLTITPVANLGEDAYYSSTHSGQGLTLRVKKGSNAFGLRVQGGKLSADQIKTMEKTLAQDALANL
ncbi:MAG: hypothetical protein WA020_16565 [Candidatus Acidiferrales bacterium]